MIAYSVRSAIVGHLLSVCGMKTTKDISKSLKPYRISKDKRYLNGVTESIERTMNPFYPGKDDDLYCITTGVKVSEDVNDNILGCLEKGMNAPGIS